MNKRFVFILAALILSVFMVSPAAAARSGEYWVDGNPDTGHTAILIDNAGLLTETEEEELFDKIKDVTNYGSAIFVTANQSYTGGIVQHAKDTLEDICYTLGIDGYNTMIFMIDMHKRELILYSGETMSKVLTTAMADTITDNVYKYAAKSQFGKCAENAFEQVFRILDGQKIAMPMRYITAALLALFAGLAVSLIAVRSKTKRKEAAHSDLMNALLTRSMEPDVNYMLLETRRVPHVEVHTGGHGGGGFHGGGGHGGGGFHGGGGHGGSGHGHGGHHGF